MTRHASALDLDELAAGLGPEEVHAHVGSCAHCAAQFARIEAIRTATLEDPRFAATFTRLPHPGARKRRAWLVPATLAAAACVALVVLWPGGGAMRAKGSASLALVDRTGGQSKSPRIGDVLEMRAHPGGHRFALVLAVDDTSTVVLWPLGGTRSGALGAGESASVKLRVTPGSVKIIGAFSDEPLDVADVMDPGKRRGAELHTLEVTPMQ